MCCVRGAHRSTMSSASPAARRSSGGKYGWDLNTRETIDTQLNVFEHFEPKLSDESRACEVLFLANIQPGLQLDVRQQCADARFVALDSMNLWIDIARDELLEVISRIDCLISTTRSCASSPSGPISSRPRGGPGPWTVDHRCQAGRARRGADHQG